jgi:hypothetical protein
VSRPYPEKTALQGTGTTGRATDECARPEKRLQTTPAFLLCSKKRKIICERAILLRLNPRDFTGGFARRQRRLSPFGRGGFHETYFSPCSFCRRRTFRFRRCHACGRELLMLEAA